MGHCPHCGHRDDAPAFLTFEARRTSRRLQAGVEYEREQVQHTIDDVGNIVREQRTTSWTDASGAARSETLTIDTRVRAPRGSRC